MKLRSGAHLGYSTNVHPGVSLGDVIANLQGEVQAVRRGLGVDRLGIGLWLSAEAAEALGDAERRAELAIVLEDAGLYVFGLNGVSFGEFHGRRVKETIFRPDWLEPERLEYTDRLAEILAELLPEGVDGTVTTLPGAADSRVMNEGQADRVAGALLRHVRTLHRIFESSGKMITLALEPEPLCMLETSADLIAFCERHLFGKRALAWLADGIGGSPAAAEGVLRTHLGVCYDTCHAAIEYEEPRPTLAAYRRAGIRVAKVQLSTGLRVLSPGRREVRKALAEFDDAVYLHQVIERQPDRLVRYTDLPEALSARSPAAKEWRIQARVPIFRSQFGLLESTQDHLREVLEAVDHYREPPQLEVESYGFGLLPPEAREPNLTSSLVRELEFAREVVGDRRLSRAG